MELQSADGDFINSQLLPKERAIRKHDFFFSNSPGQLMNWASKPATASKETFDAESESQDEDFEGYISKEVMHAIEESLNADIFEDIIRPTQPAVGTPLNRHGLTIPIEAEYIVSDPYFSQSSSTFEDSMRRIWTHNDQKASLFFQERLRQAVPGEFEQIMILILHHIEALMIHRFGNFLVQCMLELAQPDDIAYFASHLSGRMAEMSKHQFCCHVIQRLLDVSPLVIQARVAAELLDDVIDTMTSPFGTHVWQKLLHLPWPPNLPPITKLANNAVHLESNSEGWMAISSTEAGCATIKSYIGVANAGGENQECLNELLSGLPKLMVQPAGSALVARLTVITVSRARAMTLIFSRAYEYCKHPVASTVIMVLLKMKIPSFPVRLGAAIAPYYNELLADKYGETVIAALESIQKYSF